MIALANTLAVPGLITESAALDLGGGGSRADLLVQLDAYQEGKPLPPGFLWSDGVIVSLEECVGIQQMRTWLRIGWSTKPHLVRPCAPQRGKRWRKRWTDCRTWNVKRQLHQQLCLTDDGVEGAYELHPGHAHRVVPIDVKRAAFRAARLRVLAALRGQRCP